MILRCRYQQRVRALGKVLAKAFLGLSALMGVFWCSGLFLGMLQCTAWTSMTWQFSRWLPLEEAVQLALSGEEMCGMCEFVSGQSDILDEWQQQWDPNILLIFFFVMLPLGRPLGRRIFHLNVNFLDFSNYHGMRDPPVPKQQFRHSREARGKQSCRLQFVEIAQTGVS